MSDYAEPIERLIEEFRKLPGIGAKTAQRLAYSLLRRPREEAERLSKAILEIKDSVCYCSLCNNFSDSDPCQFCASPNRTAETICVVEEPHDILAINGVGPEDLKLGNLLERLKSGRVVEVILAMNPNVEGEATAIYLARLLKPVGVKVSRIALGVPMGSDLEFADEVTMAKALEHRHEL
jgi:recombination protein RecR